MVTKRKYKPASKPTLNSQLKQRLGVRFNSSIKAGRLELDVLVEDQNCEGVCTPETKDDYRALTGPKSSDFFVRGFCGPALLTRGSVVVKQTLRTDDGPMTRICCLKCSVKAEVVIGPSGGAMFGGILASPISRWISGIYALSDIRRRCWEFDEPYDVPAVLSCQFDELSSSNLTMWVLDYTRPEGGPIDWAPWVGVRLSGDRTIELFGRDSREESAQLNCQLRYTLTDSQFEELRSSCNPAAEIDTYVSAVSPKTFHQEIAQSLLPYLPLAERLSTWDREKDLDALDSGIQGIMDEDFIKLVEGRACIPLEKRFVRIPEWIDEPRQVIVEPLVQFVDVFGADEQWRIVKPIEE